MDLRVCQQCGSAFTPRREHARFCSARCRVTWNRENAGSVSVDRGPLGWAVVAMGEVVARLGRLRPKDQVQALTVISEAVWWVTIVDATLVRYHPDVYDAALSSRPDRDVVEGTLTGLRFVRNQLGYHADPADFVEPVPGRAATGWRWRTAACPALDTLSPRGQEWEASRYKAYEDRLADHTVGDTFRSTAAFLTAASASVPPAAE